MIPPEEWGNLPEIVTADKKIGISMNILPDSVYNEGNEAYVQQCGFH
jgi:hypothetical protein